MSENIINECNKFLYDYSKNVSSVTAKRIKYQFNVFIRWLEENNVVELTNDVLFEFFSYIDKKYKPNIYNLYVFMVNGFLKKFYPKLNLYLSVKVDIIHAKDDLLTYDDYIRLLQFSKALGIFEVSHYIIKFIYHTGIRIGELKFLTVENYHKKQYEIYFKGRTRMIYISDYLYEYLQDYYLKYKPRTYFFYSCKDWNKPYSVNYFQSRLKEIGFYAGVSNKSCHPHALRHLFAHAYLKTPNSTLVALSVLMGHKYINTTSVYLRGPTASFIDNLNDIR